MQAMQLDVYITLLMLPIMPWLCPSAVLWFATKNKYCMAGMVLVICEEPAMPVLLPWVGLSKLGGSVDSIKL